MKIGKKQKLPLPEVQIHGDLEDVRNLVKSVSKKKTIVIFRDAEKGQHYAEVKGEIQQFPVDLISNMSSDYRFIYFDFYPEKKRPAPAGEQEKSNEPDPSPEIVSSTVPDVKEKKKAKPVAKKKSRPEARKKEKKSEKPRAGKKKK